MGSVREGFRALREILKTSRGVILNGSKSRLLIESAILVDLCGLATFQHSNMSSKVYSTSTNSVRIRCGAENSKGQVQIERLAVHLYIDCHYNKYW